MESGGFLGSIAPAIVGHHKISLSSRHGECPDSINVTEMRGADVRQVPIHAWEFFGGIHRELKSHLENLPKLGEFMVIGPAAEWEGKGRLSALDLQAWLSA